MPTLTAVFNDQIRRLAKREAKGQARAARKLTAQHRRDIAALRRQVATLERAVKQLSRAEKTRLVEGPAPENTASVRFRAGGLKSHRARLGLSAADYGRLAGASGLSVYHWERGKTKPRREQVVKLAAVRRLGKREATARLSKMDAR